MQYLTTEDAGTMRKIGINVLALLGVTVLLLIITVALS
jgi:hypothetical protein